MNSGSPVLHALAALYSKSKAGRTGAGQRDFLVDLKELLACAGCEDGDAREIAIRQLRSLDGKLLRLEGPRRDPDIIHQVRFAAVNEAELFRLIGKLSPSEQRQQLATQFANAAGSDVPHRWQEPWQKFCADNQRAALEGAAIAPFSREDLGSNSELLALVPKLLAWHEKRDESLLRFASCVLTGDSKRLGELAPEDALSRRRGKLGDILERITGGQLRCLEDVGILQTPRFVLLHGPVRLLLSGEWLNLGLLEGPCRLSEADIIGAVKIETTAQRCLTVENETSFHELAKLHSGELLICTSYPGSATIALLQRLPESLEYWHFGDSDPEGFDIVRDLRQRSHHGFRTMHMTWRPEENSPKLDAGDRQLIRKLLSIPDMAEEHGALQAMLASGRKGQFEQESLGPPNSSKWPYYSE